MDPRNELESLSTLERGWLDGDSGEPVTICAIERAHRVIDSAEVMGITVTAVFPTEDGGVSMVFSDQVTIEVSPLGAMYAHRADLSTGTYIDLDAPPLAGVRA